MIIISQISTTLPNVMSRYLLMMAAIISVPPVLPLAEKATPMPPPQKDAPMTHAIKRLVVEKTETCRQFLNDGQKEGESKYTENSFDAKL